MVTVYALVNPLTDMVFYVGATKKNVRHRLSEHKHNNQLPSIKAGIQPEIKVLDVVPDELGRERENKWMGFYLMQGAPLENTIIESGYTTKPRKLGAGIIALKEEKKLQKKLQGRKRYTRFPL